MNIRELKEKIKDLPDHMDVFMDERLTQDEFKFGLVNSAKVMNVPFYEEDNTEKAPLGRDDVFVLSEE